MNNIFLHLQSDMGGGTGITHLIQHWLKDAPAGLRDQNLEDSVV